MCAPSAPDLSGQVATQEKIANRQLDLSEKAYADQKAMADKFLPLFEQQAQLAAQNQQTANERSDAMWKSYTDTFAPMEKQFAETAANYNTAGRREQAAQQASADVASQFDLADQQRAENMAASGVAPGSGASLAMQNASAIERAKATAQAQNQARSNVEATGLSLQNTAIGIGRGAFSGGLQAADLAMRQGSAAQGSAGGAMSYAASPYTTASGLMSAAGQSNMGAANILNSGYQNQLAQHSSNMSLFGDALGAGLTAYGMGMFSSEKMKDMGGEVSDTEALRLIDASPAKHWSYKPGMGDGSTQERMGPTAESLQGTPVSDGTQIDIPSMLGLHHAGLRAVDKKIDRLAAEVKKAGLADAKKKPARGSLADAKRKGA